MGSGVKIWNENTQKYDDVYQYSQMGIDAAMVAQINHLAVEMEFQSKVLAGLQEYCGITSEE